MRKLWAVAAGLLAVAIMATPAWADDHKVTGTMTLSSGDIGDIHVDKYDGLPCTGSDVADGYSDISSGAVVAVRNEKGKRIATGALGGGHSNEKLECIFKFKVDVPDAKIYTFEVAQRGELAYPEKKLEKAKWKVALTLGS